MIQAYQKKSTDELRQILADTKTIAVVGLSDKPNRTSNRVASYLQRQGYRIIPVNPTITEALGEKAYPSLHDVPDAIDIVEVFRRAEYVPPVVEDAIAVGAKGVWIQTGIINEEAAARAQEAGLITVMDECMLAVHQQLRAQGRI